MESGHSRVFVWVFITLLTLATLGHAQTVECVTVQKYQELCRFADGSVTETFTTPGHYSQFDFTGDQARKLWVEETVTKPAAAAQKEKSEHRAFQARQKAEWLDRASRFSRTLQKATETGRTFNLCKHLFYECGKPFCDDLNNVDWRPAVPLTSLADDPNCTKEEAEDINKAFPQQDPMRMCGTAPNFPGCREYMETMGIAQSNSSQ